MIEQKAPEPYGFGPLTSECRRRGIGRTFAYELINRGLLDTFMLGQKRYVYIKSLESLPQRIAQEARPVSTRPRS